MREHESRARAGSGGTPPITPRRPEQVIAASGFLRLLWRAQWLPGALGRSAGRKLRRRLQPAAQQSFDARVGALRPGDVVIDLGANIGEVTLRLAASGATVHAYEPDPETFARLALATGGLPNVRLFREAVADRAGTLRFFRARADVLPDEVLRGQSASLLFMPRHSDAGDTVDVTAVPLTEALRRAQGDGRLRLIKMDIEGAELAILDALLPEGAADPALPCEAIFVETHETLLPAHWPGVRRLRDLAARLPGGELNLYWH